jgi:hypothetical protein
LIDRLLKQKEGKTMLDDIMNRRVTITNNGSFFYENGGKIIGKKNNQFVIIVDNGHSDLILANENDFRLFGDY